MPPPPKPTIVYEQNVPPKGSFPCPAAPTVPPKDGSDVQLGRYITGLAKAHDTCFRNAKARETYDEQAALPVPIPVAKPAER